MGCRAISLRVFAAVIACLSLSAAADDWPSLQVNDLLSGARPAAIIDNRAFVPSPTARQAQRPFHGELRVVEALMQTLPADLGVHAVLGKDPRYFPALHCVPISAP